MADAQPTHSPTAPAGTTTLPPTVDPTKTVNSAHADAPFTISTRQNRERWFKFLVYAKHGAGKTELLCSAADCEQMGDVLFVDAESGDLTVEDSPRIKNHAMILDNRVEVKNFQQVVKLQQFLKAYCSARDRNDVATMIKMYKFVTGIDTDNPPRYRTVIVDSLTEVEAYCTYQVMNVDPDKVLMEEGGMDVAGWPEFRKNYEMVKLLVRAYRDLPMNVLMAAADQYSKDENSRQHYGPRLTGKLGSEVQGFFDVVGYLTVGAVGADGGEAPRRLFVQPIQVTGAPRFDAKNRRPVFKNAYMDNPSMTSMMRDFGLTRATPA